MTFAIKAEVRNPRATTFAFAAQKTMYGSKDIAEGDPLFVFASENEGAVSSCGPLSRPPKPSRRSATLPGKHPA